MPDRPSKPLPPPLPPDAFDDEDDDKPMGSAADVQDGGPLEALGKAVSAPMRGAAEPDDPALERADRPSDAKPSATKP